jgi:hypothetical protein
MPHPHASCLIPHPNASSHIPIGNDKCDVLKEKIEIITYDFLDIKINLII